MLNLKDRIAILKNRTTSGDAITIANAAMEACKTNGFMDSVIAENLVKDLSGIDDAEVQKFVLREQRLVEISNLGVNEAYKNLVNGDLMHYPTIKPIIESMQQNVKSLPEYRTAEHFVNALQQYSWNTELRNDLTKITESVEKYKEDIALMNFIYEFNNSSAAYLSKMFADKLDDYFIDRTESNRKSLLEKINPYLFDSQLKYLHDILIESEGGFQIKADGEVLIEKIYSPVIINEKEEIFFSSGRFLKKVNESVKILNEAELKRLPESFMKLSYFLSQPNVKVYENKIVVTTESGNKVVEVISENEKTILKLNGKEMPYATFTKYFMNEGVFRQSDNNVLHQVAVLYENIDNVYEIDYGKRLVSKTSAGQWADVFKVGSSVCVTKVQESQKVNEFISNINAVQTKQLILEHLRFDISESLRDMLPEEMKKLENLNLQKTELNEAIQLLTNKKAQVETQVNENAVLRANREVKELLEAIDIEINNLKEQDHAVNNMIKSLTRVQMFSNEDFTNENFIDDFWKKADKNAVLYFAQEDEKNAGKYLVGMQSYKEYKDDFTWVPIDTNLSKDAAVKIAKDKAAKDKFGQYIETEDVMENVITEAVTGQQSKDIAVAIIDTIKNKMGGKLTKEMDLDDMIEDYAQYKNLKVNDLSKENITKLVKREFGVKESKDPDGVEKLDNQNKDMNLSDDIKKNEDAENPLESGDEVRLKNGKVGVVQGNDSNNHTIILMEDGKSVAVPQEFLHEIEILKKKSNESVPQIKTGDGSTTVEIRESKDEDWVKGVLVNKQGAQGDEILIHALDYTSKGDSDEIRIKTGKTFDKEGKTLKKFTKVIE